MSLTQKSIKQIVAWRFQIVVVLCVVFFTVIGYRNLDPDFGWHFQLGKIITTTGIPKSDPFTFTMPSYPFVDYEWGSNVFMYVVYSQLGKLILSFIFAVCAVLSVLLLTSNKRNIEQFFLFVLGTATLIQYVGIRPQVFSWLFLALLIKVLYSEDLWRKWRYAFPFLMLLWANIHGSYPIAFVLVAAFFAGDFLQKRRLDFTNIFVIATGAFATLLNPYGIENWIEVVKQMGETGLYRKTIGEWQPIYTHFVIGFWFLLTLLILLGWKYRTKIKWSYALVSIVTTVMAVTSVRHVSIFVLTNIPLLYFCITLLKKEVSAVKHGNIRFSQLMMVLTFLSLGVLGEQLFLTAYKNYGEENMFPKQAVEYLRNNINAPVFNTYEWGGYLIWKLPDRKVFVDGRTPGFSWKAPQNESNDIYKEYLQVVAGKGNWQDILKKYNIEYVLLETKDMTYTEPSQMIKTIEAFYAKWLVGWGDSQYFGDIPFGITLKNNGWSIVYQDDIATILKKP